MKKSIEITTDQALLIQTICESYLADLQDERAKSDVELETLFNEVALLWNHISKMIEKQLGE